LRVVTGGRTHPAVAGDQRSVKKFSQSYIGSIIGGKVVAANKRICRSGVSLGLRNFEGGREEWKRS